jgi:Zn-dependent protease with chaperone function
MYFQKTFPEISPRAFIHPADQAALSVLRSVKGFDLFLRKTVGGFGERRIRLIYLSNSIRVGPTQNPALHRLLEETCQVLDLRELPELYITTEPAMNAWAIGMDKPFIVLSHSLVQSLEPEEIKCVLAHEVGHILAGHSLYKTMLLVLLSLASRAVSLPVSVLSLPLLIALKEWDRKSELSSDRAGLLVTQDLRTSQRVLMKISGAGSIQDFSIDAFESQAREVEENKSLIDHVFKLLNSLWISHPFPVQRVLELRQFAESPEYAKILSGDYPRRTNEDLNSLQQDLKKGMEHYAESASDFAELARDFGQKSQEFLSGVFKDIESRIKSTRKD